MLQNIPSFGKSLSLLSLIFIAIILLASGLFITIALIGASIVPLTWLYGIITGQSYERVCDNSEILYQLNRIGKWTIIILIGILLIKLIIF
jgi:hypothetical protein